MKLFRKTTLGLAFVTAILSTALASSAYAHHSPFSGSELSFGSTDLANKSKTIESEFENRIQVDTRRIKARVNYNLFHVGLEDERISAKTDIEKLNTERLWLGVGVHTTKNTYFTYWDDMNSGLWRVSVDMRTPLRGNLDLLANLWHLDDRGGTLSKSGGRRTTALGFGFRYNFNKHIAAQAMLEINNQGQRSVEDRLLTGIVATY